MAYFVSVDALLGGALLGVTSVTVPGYGSAQRIAVPAQSSSVDVYLRGTTTHVSLFTDQHGGGSAIVQPATVDADGRVVDPGGGGELFVQQPAELDVVVSGGILTVPRTIPVGEAGEATATTRDGPQTALGTNYTPQTLTMALKRVSRTRGGPSSPRGGGVLPEGDAVTLEWLPDSMYLGQNTIIIPPTPNPPAGGSYDTAHENGIRFVSGATNAWTQQFQLTGDRMRAPYMAITARVEALVAGDTFSVGWWNPGTSQGLLARYQLGTGLSINNNGTITAASGTGVPATPPAVPFTLGLIVCYPYLIGVVVYDSGDVHFFGQQTLATDLRVPANAAAWQPSIGIVQAVNSTTQVSQIRAGFLGMGGFRDPALITYPDGTPFTKDGYYYLVFTNAVGGPDFRANFQMVARVHPTTYALEPVSRLFYTSPNINGGAYAGALYGGHVIYDPVSDTFNVYPNGWGAQATMIGVGIYAASTRRDITEPGTYFLAANLMTLPLPATFTSGAYDNSIRYDAAQGLWLMAAACANASQQAIPALFSAPGPITNIPNAATVWTLVASDPANQTEGCRWVKVGGQWWILTTSGSGWFGHGASFQVYNASLVWQTNISNAWFPAGTPNTWASPSPAPCVLPVHDDAVTRYLLITQSWGANYFDTTGQGSRGEFMCMEATQQPAGHEFPIRRLWRAR